MTEYAERSPRELGEYYTTHIMAMTAEELHDKSDIAAELAYRDKYIAELEIRNKLQAEAIFGFTKQIIELEEIIEEWREERDSVREEREQLKAENQRLQGENESLLVERRRLEAELDKCKMRTLSQEADRLVSEYTTKYKALEAENQRLLGALPPPNRLRLLADWFDCNHFSPDTEVQDDLRKWAEAIEQALGGNDELG